LISTDANIREDSFDTQLPMNINDSDLLPDAVLPPQPRVGLTDMTLTLLSCDVGSAVRILQQSRPALRSIFDRPAPMSIEQKDTMVHQFHQQLRSKYLQYCDGTHPIAYPTKTACELYICKMQLMSSLPLKRSGVPISKEQNDKIFVTSIKVLEYSRNLQTDKTKPWHWFYRTFFQRHAVASLLSELCERTPDEHATHAWEVLNLAFQDWRDSHQLGSAGLLTVTMRKLIARARRKREFDLGMANMQRDQLSSQESGVDPQMLISRMGNSEAPPPQVLPLGAYQEQWQQQPPLNLSAPVPWLLEDSTLKDLGVDMSVLDEDGDWESLNNLEFGFQADASANDGPIASRWAPTW
jgi:hypothetical protein